MTSETAPSALLDLLTAQRTRRETADVLQRALRGETRSLSVELSRLDEVAKLCDLAMQETYPDYQVPPASCWRMLESSGMDRWDSLASARGFSSAEDLLQVAGDLAILLGAADVNPPEDWIYTEPGTGEVHRGRTALFIAVFAMFQSGVFSADPNDPLRVDVDALIRLEEDEIAASFGLDRSVHPKWLAAMTGHLRRFGEVVGMRPDVFGHKGTLRPGRLLVAMLKHVEDGDLKMSTVFDSLSDALAPLWNGAAQEGDLIFGDSWRLESGDDEIIVPLHHAVQALAFNLIEPFSWAGIGTSGFEELPAPSDGIHAGLLVASGAIRPEDAAPVEVQRTELRAVSSALIVELAARLRQILETDADGLPLPCIIEGGTVRAAAKLAMENPEAFQKVRNILSTGAVFWAPKGA